jgi:hypothetical protein
MTENAKIARLWSGFHRLSEADKDLVLAVSEAAKRPEKSRPEEWAGKEPQEGIPHKKTKLS